MSYLASVYLSDSGMWKRKATRKMLSKLKPRAIHTKYCVECTT